MCGIIGVLGQRYNKSFYSKLLNLLTHRGPDSKGEWYNDGVWLAHRRLAILDLSSHGAQPMSSPCKRFIITFNGEIYNYKELRVELEAEGYKFIGTSDTEVVLAACTIWGIEKAIIRFVGMFAFGLYECVSKVLWLVRDPMGIKPLYYTQIGDKFAFSSELTPLLHLSWIDKTIDQNALYHYFRYLYIPTPLSIFSNIKKLSSGSVLRLENQAFMVKTYWNLSENAFRLRGELKTRSINEVADELEKTLRCSVKLHMLSDVPYGAFLSGGIDSSLIVALMQKEASQPVKTFSVGFSENSHDESVYAKTIAKHLGTDHYELILNANDVPELIPKVMSFFDEPFADNSAVPTYLISQFARNTVTVCLSGDGGDELFGGYPRYFWAKRIENLKKKLSPLGAMIIAKMIEKTPPILWDKLIDGLTERRYSGSEGLSNRVYRFANYLKCKRETVYAQNMSVWKEPSILLGDLPYNPIGVDLMRYPSLDWAEEMMLIDQEVYLQDDILTKVDRASMAVSLETRVPFLTHNIVEESWKIASSLKLAEQGDRGKLILREILYKHVPKELIERPKQGFGMPVGVWLRSSLKEWAISLLHKSELEMCGLNAKVVNNIWQEHQDGQDRQAMIWAVLMYRQWYQRVFTY